MRTKLSVVGEPELPTSVYETEEAYKVDIEAPGADVGAQIVVSPENVMKVQVAGAVSTPKSPIFNTRKTVTGSLEVELPDSVDVKKINSVQDNGVITITLGKKELPQPTVVSVKKPRVIGFKL